MRLYAQRDILGRNFEIDAGPTSALLAAGPFSVFIGRERRPVRDWWAGRLGTSCLGFNALGVEVVFDYRVAPVRRFNAKAWLEMCAS